MTTAQMVTHVRTLFDEDSSGFLTDTMIKRSLDNGHKLLAHLLYQGKKAHLLYTLESSESNSYSTLDLPSNFWMFKSGYLNSKALRLRTGDKEAKEGNSYLAGTADCPYIYIAGSEVDFDPTPSSGTWTMRYYVQPSNLTTTESNLPDEVHVPICQYAFADLLMRDSKHQEAMAEFEKFYKMVDGL